MAKKVAVDMHVVFLYQNCEKGVSINGDTPIAGWFIRENPNPKWMMTGGTPMT